ncbi:flagellar assembly protein FliT [Photorhabdus luminescens]|uniref:Flagellar protein FliT n=1 Tax=Photorhabdus luminescens subsp. mexicana TaxID=2100167 RepID=A0A4R4IWB3_PHOLU|nr:MULTISPECIES: flagella biosynthesis regulatory protein FliT [Photorhabdus]MCW7548959.1 flagella biosynthesis regulatory protein FliT [Photorhabdus aballayi]MCW7760377.1 flagella biosynthesis regulatory protein FliT [Photorhabdus luminescens subsp. venezuelensis]OWO84077.1 flagellar assembly protein FliT [Photorhabdus luminescens]TDB45217.1 flagella biosynthesis regulatory protein FliT [Photorhabdus luminescens subsp. mexicana]
MDNEMDLLSAYQRILSLSEQMLNLAKNEKWDELVDMEITYLKAVEVISHSSISSTVSLSLQQKMTNILQIILDNENEIKKLLQQRLDELSKLIKQASQQQLLNDSYGQFPVEPYHTLMNSTEQK